MATFPWPSVLKPESFGYYQENADTSGGPALDLGEQFVVSPGGRWRAAGRFPITKKDQALAIRALRANLKGRANSVALPNFDGIRLSWPPQIVNGASTGRILNPGVTRDKALDDTEYEDPEIPPASEIVAKAYTAAAERATTLEILSLQGGRIRPGQQFGLAQRIYEIGTAAQHALNASVTVVTFWPTLRADVAVGDTVKFTRPTCLMRCLNLNDALKDLDRLRSTKLNLEFAESI